ncbi:TIGR02281 family clan AA aspartic protease [Flammeovirga sp. SJP92]|uniref:retropepsin-like aspartic protease family protein n=1 Tax=Flammeovirga sp. SJP92 TaxID=1775430 RepID=UPI0012FB2F89|nr:retropepsin-like aspartic protease [Flammeovirga sp. SJP92]
MRKIITLLICLVSIQGLAQVKQTKVPYRDVHNAGVKYIDIKVNGVPQTCIIDTGASGVTLNRKTFISLVQQGVIYQHHVTGKRQVALADGSLVEVYTFKISQLQIGDLILRNIEGYITPSDDAASLLGQSLLDRFGSVTFNNQAKLLEIEYTPISFSSLKKIKLIPCLKEDQVIVKQLLTSLQQQKELQQIDFEIENQLPPQNAVDRVSEGSIALRSFSQEGVEMTKSDGFLTFFETFIKSHSGQFLEQHVYDENMTFYYANEMQGYLEVWVRSK